MNNLKRLEIAESGLSNKEQFLQQVQANPKLMSAIWKILTTILLFAKQRAIDPQTGAKIKIKWWHFIVRKEYRVFVWTIIDEVMGLFAKEEALRGYS